MPTPTGLPKAGDHVYNDYFKQRFRVMRRSSNSFPLTIYIRPMPGKDFPDTMLKGRRRMPDGTYPLLLEAPMDDMFRIGVSHWTNLPKPDDVQKQRCPEKMHETHGAHMYLAQRVWFYCPGVRRPPAMRSVPERAGTPDDPIARYKANRDAGMTDEQQAHRAAGTTRVTERRITAFLEDTEETDPAIRLAQAEELLRQARSALRRARRN